MPIPAPFIAAGAELLGQGIGAISQGIQNRKQRQWNEKMYHWQRSDAINDWVRQNEYNHPSSQMARLREAGLNPNLVYGNGATTTAAPIRSTESKAWNPKAPEFNPGSSLAAYFETQARQQTIDNLRQQNTVLANEAILKEAQTIATLANAGLTGVSTESKKFDLAMKTELKDTSIETAKSILDKIKVDTQAKFDENERRAAMLAPTIQKAVEEILNLRLSRAKTRAEINNLYQMGENLKSDNRLKQLDINLKSKGIQPGDPAWMRAIIQIFSGSKVTSDNVNPKFYESLGIKPK